MERLGRKNWGSGAKDQLSFANDRMDGNREGREHPQTVINGPLASSFTKYISGPQKNIFLPTCPVGVFYDLFHLLCSHTLTPVTHVQLCSQNTHCLSLKTLVPKTVIALSLFYLKNLLLLVSIISNKFKTLKQNSSFLSITLP